jgi:iron complex outermembrane receptor protein
MTFIRRLAVFLIPLCAGLGASPAFAQQGATVTGTVVTNSGAPVVGAMVALESVTGTREIKTGTDGKFSLANVPPGPYHLSVRADGFLSTRVDLTVAGTAPAVEVKLAASPHFSEVVSVSPDARSQFDSYQPTSVLGGQDLAAHLKGTLAATLDTEPGVATRSFGPGPARPVIRGLDGDRVLVLEDGQRMGDLSSQSGDHGVNVNPASASKIEVVRGPATLLYGANAIGGLVNVVTKSIPTAPVFAPTGSITFDAGSAASEAGGAGDVTVGRGSLALHLSGSGRRSGNYATPAGDIPNSFNRAGFFEAGLSHVTNHGYVGGSFAYDRTHYGIPLVENGETNLDPRRKIFDLRAERRNLSGPFSSIRLSFGARRYQHDELDGTEVATLFINNTTEFEFRANHRQAGRLKGTLGASVLTRTFSAQGEEILSPKVSQKGFSGFLYEEAALSRHVTLQFGGRLDRTIFDPTEALTLRRFTNASGSVGLLVHPSDRTTIAFSLASASRNPALEELYFHGPHGGNAVVENGDETLKTERALGFDTSFRWEASRASGEVTYFVNRVKDFIFRQLTGEIDELPVSFFTQGDATLHGIESHLDLHASELVWIEAGLDYVHGQLTSVGMPLPRMPPLRGRVGIRLQKNAFQAGVTGTFTAKQNRIFSIATPDGPVGETATGGYSLVKLFAAYSFVHGRTTSTLAVRLDNAGNVLYHNHLNYLKDLAPELGRDFRVTYTVAF